MINSYIADRIKKNNKSFMIWCFILKEIERSIRWLIFYFDN